VRLDLFLKTSGLVKRRTVAQELCDAGRVLVNGAAAKPAKEVRPGDILTVTFSSRTVEIEVLGLPLKSRTAAPEESYRIRSEERRQDENRL
jgi:ribosomal 50S subunit-recycling heat shock protein